MIITILCEPRTGSTNLCNSFRKEKNFTVLYEPITQKNNNFYPETLSIIKNNYNPKLWHYKTDYCVVKEVLSDDVNIFADLIAISKKIILLYRENDEEQFESFSHALISNVWHSEWQYKKNFIINDNHLSHFKKVKKLFNNLLQTTDYFRISYEDLYYNNGIEKIKNYLQIDELKYMQFPIGKRYRINDFKRKNII